MSSQKSKSTSTTSVSHSIQVWESLDDLQELLNRMVNKGWAASWHHVEGDRGWTIFVKEETK